MKTMKTMKTRTTKRWDSGFSDASILRNAMSALTFVAGLLQCSPESQEMKELSKTTKIAVEVRMSLRFYYYASSQFAVRMTLALLQDLQNMPEDEREALAARVKAAIEFMNTARVLITDPVPKEVDVPATGADASVNQTKDNAEDADGEVCPTICFLQQLQSSIMIYSDRRLALPNRGTLQTNRRSPLRGGDFLEVGASSAFLTSACDAGSAGCGRIRMVGRCTRPKFPGSLRQLGDRGRLNTRFGSEKIPSFA